MIFSKKESNRSVKVIEMMAFVSGCVDKSKEPFPVHNFNHFDTFIEIENDG